MPGLIVAVNEAQIALRYSAKGGWLIVGPILEQWGAMGVFLDFGVLLRVIWWE